MTAVRFCFDYISPYAYLAWTRIHAVAEATGAEVEPVPVLFAAMLNHHGHKGPAEIPSKRLYVGKNIVRLAADLGVPLDIPPTHPFNPLLALRVSSLPMPAEVRRRLIDGLYAATWRDGLGVTDPDVVARVAEEAGVTDPLTRATAAENKARLKQQTAAAIAAGVFGVPTMLVGDEAELFWGVDSLPHLARYLEGADPVSPELMARWSQIEASARRG